MKDLPNTKIRDKRGDPEHPELLQHQGLDTLKLQEFRLGIMNKVEIGDNLVMAMQIGAEAVGGILISLDADF